MQCVPADVRSGLSSSIRFSRQRPFTIVKFNRPLNDGNGILTCRCHVVEPMTAMAEDLPVDSAG